MINASHSSGSTYGRVPKHQVILWDIKGDTSRDVRMRSIVKHILDALKMHYPKPGKKP